MLLSLIYVNVKSNVPLIIAFTYDNSGERLLFVS